MEKSGKGTERKRRGLLLVLFIPLFPLFLLSGPLLKGRGDIPGMERGEVWGHIWSYFSSGTKIEGVRPYRELNGVNFPSGIRWLSVDPLNEVIVKSIHTLTASIPFSYTLLILLHIFLAGAGAFLLARELTGSLEGGIVASGIVMGNPFLLGEVEGGISESASLGIMIFFILFTVKGLKKGGGVFLFPALVSFLLLSFSGYYLLVGGSLLLLFFSIFRILAKRGMERLKPLLLLLFVSLTLLLHYFFNPSPQIHRPGSPGLGTGGENEIRGWRINSGGGADLLNFLVPANTGRPMEDPPLPHLTYLGYSVILLGILGIRTLSGTGYRLPLLLSLGTALLLSFGMEIRASGRLLIPSWPMVILSKIPPLSAVNNYYRFHSVTLLVAAVLAGGGAARILTNAGRTPGRYITFALLLILLPPCEYAVSGAAPVPLSSASARVPGAYDFVRSNFEGGVIDFPSSGRRTIVQKALYYHLFHRLPVANNPNVTGFPSLSKSVVIRGLEHSIRTGDISSLPPSGEALCQRERLYLYGMGFRALIFHRDYLEEGFLPRVEAILKETLGEAVYSGERELVFRISP